MNNDRKYAMIELIAIWLCVTTIASGFFKSCSTYELKVVKSECAKCVLS